ncbi:MAG: hypothetical protein M2R45_02605 [Verrucomicrobia subdivision 3 bacterium]|nr:hypothetical protein [Limisphaerales bacterium]MCS1416427.1 hypothetical protein [Limisphaerales bacterium]
MRPVPDGMVAYDGTAGNGNAIRPNTSSELDSCIDLRKGLEESTFQLIHPIDLAQITIVGDITVARHQIIIDFGTFNLMRGRILNRDLKSRSR